jgi:uncharacterized protein (TIGR01777 family)
MRIVISGSSGLVGEHLVPELESRGHQVVRLVRNPRLVNERAAFWNPTAGLLDPEALDGADVVINLNGRNVGSSRWSPKVRSELRSSRVVSTEVLAGAIARAESPPALLINASATGYYGDRGEEVLDESSPRGAGFLAELCDEWEQAAQAAHSQRTRVVTLRLGIVVAAGGALGKMLLPFRLGLGGPIGGGAQWWPWVSMVDVVEAIVHVIDHPELAGPVNLVAPQPVRCRDFAATLGRALSRPAFLPLPAFAARLALGEMADALLLSSARVRPGVLESSGYRFRMANLETAIRGALTGAHAEEKR